MVFNLLLGFLVLVTASYIGTKMALRSFFGRERYRPPAESESGGPPGNGDGERPADQRTDDVPRASDMDHDRDEED